MSGTLLKQRSPEPIDVKGGPWDFPLPYFNVNLRCGQLKEEVQDVLGHGHGWVPGKGCGAQDWKCERVFRYPSPGSQWKLTCNNCGKVAECMVIPDAEPAREA